jgi:hypothetical protein
MTDGRNNPGTILAGVQPAELDWPLPFVVSGEAPAVGHAGTHGSLSSVLSQ